LLQKRFRKTIKPAQNGRVWVTIKTKKAENHEKTACQKSQKSLRGVFVRKRGTWPDVVGRGPRVFPKTEAGTIKAAFGKYSIAPPEAHGKGSGGGVKKKEPSTAQFHREGKRE